MNENTQNEFWEGEFGDQYTERNTKDLDSLYLDNYGISRTAMNIEFLDSLPRDIKILEIGCNQGLQLEKLAGMNFTNLWGIEINYKAFKAAKQKFDNILQCTAQDLPFRDNYFDLVFTSGVLIHIDPSCLKTVIAEIYRVSKNYIWGFEYYSSEQEEIPYRGHSNKMWKADFASLIMSQFANIKKVKERRFNYLNNQNTDSMYLLQKSILEEK